MKWWAWLVLVAMLAGVLSLAYLNFKKPKEKVITDEPSPVLDSDDVEAMARMIASENNGKRDTRDIKIAVAWTTRNYARRVNKTVFKLLMPNGLPAPQKGRYASTAQPATAETREIARLVLSGQVADNTKGSIQFDAPETQDILYARGDVSSDSTMIGDSRRAEGKTEYHVPGVNPRYMRWWRYA